MAQVFGIVALKGGVGKTTLVANLGAALAQKFDKKVLLIDANFSTPHLGLHLGIINPDHSLHPVLNEEYSIYESIYQHPIGLHVIPGKLSPGEVEPLILKEKIQPLREIYDVILIDSSPSPNDEMVATMAASDEILVVSSPDFPTLSSTIHAVKIAKEQKTPIRGIIVNKVRKKKFELGKREISDALDSDVLAIIPDDVKVQAALARMLPVTSFAPRHKISEHYYKLAADLIGEEYKKSLFSKLKSKKKKNENK